MKDFVLIFYGVGILREDMGKMRYNFRGVSLGLVSCGLMGVIFWLGFFNLGSRLFIFI